MRRSAAILFITIFASLAFWTGLARAEEVPAEDALKAAQAWIDRGYSMARLDGRTVAGVETIESDDAKMYVAKVAGGGFIVMSADDLIEPVIAFSDDGSALDEDDANPLWALVRADIAARTAGVAGTVPVGSVTGTVPAVKTLAATTGERTRAQSRWDELLVEAPTSGVRRASAASVSTISDIRVDSFIAAKWNQSTVGSKNVYNYYTPSNYYCGCVATATAEIMRHFE